MIQYKVLFPSDSPYRPEYHRKMRNRSTLTSFFLLGSLLCLQLTFARALEAEERTGPASTSTDENTGMGTENSDPTSGERESRKTPEQKALDELAKHLKEMEESVDFPVGPSNRLLTENREAYEKRDLPALAKSLLSRNQLYGIVIWKGKHRLSIFDQRGIEILSFEAGIGGDAQGGQRPK